MKKPDITSGFFFFPPQNPVPGCRFTSQLHIPPVFAGRFLFCIFRFWGAYSFCLRHPSAPHPLSAFKRQRRPFRQTPSFSFDLSAPIKLSSAWPEISGIQKNFKRQRRPFRQTPPFSFDLSAPKKLSSAWPEISGIQKNFKRQRRPFRQTPPFSFDLSAPKKLSSAWPEISGIQKNFKRQRRPFRQTPRSHLTSPPQKNSPQPDRKFPGYKKLSPRGEFSDKKKIRFQRLLPLSLTIPAGSELVCGLRTRRTFAGLGSRAFSTRSSPPHS